MANTVDLYQTVPAVLKELSDLGLQMFAQTCLSENLGALQFYYLSPYILSFLCMYLYVTNP